jgi:uncharacterized DUF497 family protein
VDECGKEAAGRTGKGPSSLLVMVYSCTYLSVSMSNGIDARLRRTWPIRIISARRATRRERTQYEGVR